MENSKDFEVYYKKDYKLVILFLHLIFWIFLSFYFILFNGRISQILILLFFLIYLFVSYRSLVHISQLFKIKGNKIIYKTIFNSSVINYEDIKEKKLVFNNVFKNGGYIVLKLKNNNKVIGIKLFAINAKKLWIFLGGKEEDFERNKILHYHLK